jgi:hypothetical protein
MSEKSEEIVYEGVVFEDKQEKSPFEDIHEDNESKQVKDLINSANVEAFEALNNSNILDEDKTLEILNQRIKQDEKSIVLIKQTIKNDKSFILDKIWNIKSIKREINEKKTLSKKVKILLIS